MPLYFPQSLHLDQARVLLLRQPPHVAGTRVAGVVNEGVGEEPRHSPVVDGDLPGDERQPQPDLGQHLRSPGPGAEHWNGLKVNLQYSSRDVSLSIPSDGAEWVTPVLLLTLTMSPSCLIVSTSNPSTIFAPNFTAMS